MEKMPTCCIKSCGNSGRKISGKSFHRFPSCKTSEGRQLYAAWVSNIGNPGWEPSAHSLLCINHFEEKWVDRSSERTRLRPGAVPTLFHGNLPKAASRARPGVPTKPAARKAFTEYLFMKKRGGQGVYYLPELSSDEAVGEDQAGGPVSPGEIPGDPLDYFVVMRCVGTQSCPGTSSRWTQACTCVTASKSTQTGRVHKQLCVPRASRSR